MYMDGLREVNPSLLAYLSYMTERLIYMRGLLKTTGILYLHCDPTTSHYLKIMLDAILGHKNFQNEIVWCYTGPGSLNMRQFNRKHDLIYWYSVGRKWVFNVEDVRLLYKDAMQKRRYRRFTRITRVTQCG